jgi:hypothetical protein
LSETQDAELRSQPARILSKKKRRGIFACCLFAFIFTVVPGGTQTSSSYTAYFYSAETNINNFSSLKTEFDAYLSTRGKYLFQPFSQKDTFEENVKSLRDGVLLLSSWHCKMLKDRLPMKPILVGLLNHRPAQTRLLSVKKNDAKMESLRNGSIASAGSEEYTRALLLSMLGEKNRDLVDSTKILIVPKDIDALLAVSFGMAKGALTTESSVSKLKAINPKQYGLLAQVAVSDGILLPVVAVRGNIDASMTRFLSVIEEMGENPAGVELLKMRSFLQ